MLENQFSALKAYHRPMAATLVNDFPIEKRSIETITEPRRQSGPHERITVVDIDSSFPTDRDNSNSSGGSDTNTQ